MTEASTVIVSRIGNGVVVEWDALTLRHTLNQLRSERQRYRYRYQTPENGANMVSLLSEAEQVKTATENKIREVESSA